MVSLSGFGTKIDNFLSDVTTVSIQNIGTQLTPQ